MDQNNNLNNSQYNTNNTPSNLNNNQYNMNNIPNNQNLNYTQVNNMNNAKINYPVNPPINQSTNEANNYQNLTNNTVVSQGITETNSNQNLTNSTMTYQSNYNNQLNLSVPKKKKFKWYIPVLFFVAYIIITIARTAIKYTLYNYDDESANYQLLINIYQKSGLVAVLCTLAILISLIVVTLMYLRTTQDEKDHTDELISKADSLDEKLLIAYIGNNYEKIIKEKFSFSMLFFSFFYTFYRKLFIPTTVFLLIFSIILNFLPDPAANFIFIVTCIIFGVYFNKLYVIYVKKKIEKIKINNPNADEYELINICKSNGGTSILLMIVYFILYLICDYICTNLFSRILSS